MEKGGRKVNIRATVHEKIIPTTVNFENNRGVWAREGRQPGEAGTYKGSDVPKKPSEENTPLTQKSEIETQR